MIRYEEGGFDDYEFTLGPEMAKKAKCELHEDDETRKRSIVTLRKKIESNEDLVCPTDDVYLLRWLRFGKFNPNLAYDTLIKYYTMKADNSDLFNNLSPDSIGNALEDGVSYVLPNKDKHGRHVIVHRHGRWNFDDYSVFDLLKTDVVNLDMIAEDESSHINGYVILVDLSGFQLQHFQHMRRRESVEHANLLTNTFPLELKQMVIWKPTAMYTTYMAISSLFVPDELTQKTVVCNEPEELTRLFGEGVVPREYSTDKSMPFGNELAMEWKAKLDANEHLFRMKLRHSLDLHDTRVTRRDPCDVISSIANPLQNLQLWGGQ